jgi:hypothetical protein
MKNSQFPIARKDGLVVQEVPGELLVYDLDSDEAHCLNETAAIVWNACDGKTSVSDIAAVIAATSKGEATDDLVWLAIDQLNERNLLEEEIAPKFTGESRRDVLKKIGLGTMIAMPIIASLAAPKSVLSSCSCHCESPFDCQAQAPNCPSPTICNGTGFCAP